jgi:hypothetical protein
MITLTLIIGLSFTFAAIGVTEKGTFRNYITGSPYMGILGP